jgi:hypothetical protein
MLRGGIEREAPGNALDLRIEAGFAFSPRFADRRHGGTGVAGRSPTGGD